MNNGSKIFKSNYEKYNFRLGSFLLLSFYFKLDHDREELLQQSHLLREQIKDFENKFDEQSFTISQLNQELNDQKTTSSQLRYLSEEAERLVQENQRQLNLKKEELRAQEDKTLRFEKKLCM